MKYFLIILTMLIYSSCTQKYDKEIWTRNVTQNSDNPRFDMVEDLRRNYLLKETNSKDVFELLNEAENIDTTEFGIHWTYSIGSKPGFNIDPYFLIIDFDSMGHLTSTRIIEH